MFLQKIIFEIILLQLILVVDKFVAYILPILNEEIVLIPLQSFSFGQKFSILRSSLSYFFISKSQPSTSFLSIPLCMDSCSSTILFYLKKTFCFVTSFLTCLDC